MSTTLKHDTRMEVTMMTSNTSKTAKNNDEVAQIKHEPLILLVEDTPLIQLVHRRFLELMNCKVLIAENGQKALELFEVRPDLVLLDIGMPGLNGIEVCRIMRGEEHNGRTPIIGLTAYGKIIEYECRSAGMDDFAVKPISGMELYAMICQWLPKFRSILKPIT